jgi:signal transduction histidine kinase
MRRRQNPVRNTRVTSGPNETSAKNLARHPLSRTRQGLAITVALVLALVIDWLFTPIGYPVAAAYGISLLLAVRLLNSPRAVAATAGAALVLSIASDLLQRAPLAATVTNNAGLLAIAVLAVLLTSQRAVAEAARQRLALQYGAARTLAEAPTVDAASEGILGLVAMQLGWARGALWRVDSAAEVLHCVATWREPGAAPDHFDEQTRSASFARGTGLPGHVWADGHTIWLSDFEQETDFPRQAAAREAGLHAALAFPVGRGDDVLGIAEFFSSEINRPDEEVMALVRAVGAQLGLFLARRQAVEEVAALLTREQAAHAEADTAVALRDSFLASVSHDLKGPLTAIRGYAQLASRDLRDAGDPVVIAPASRALANIQKLVQQMASALDELLDLAQLQAGRQLTLRRQPTDLVALVRRGVSDQQITSSTCDIAVETQFDDLIGSWDCDRLQRVVGNLLSNAVKYSPAGGDICVRLERKVDAGHTWAILAVEDHGIGIPADDVPHIFEAFRRAANASGTIRGTGLGLAGAREIVEQHGGQIAVDSREGHGSVFTVKLPLES